MKFTKMHGLGNDFIVIDNLSGEYFDFPQIARKVCRRRFHVGADGILVIQGSEIADLRMKIYNSDGSEAEMCGNGIRCFARYAYDKKIINKKKMTIETSTGIIKPEIIGDPSTLDNYLVKVDMGAPVLQRSKIPVAGDDSEVVLNEKINIDGEEYIFTAVSFGNPHCVIFTGELTDRLVRVIGPKIECHPLFPARTNVEFVHVENRNHVTVRVWERGVGETLACGTGSCASVVAGILNNLLDRKVRVTLPGGDLYITWEEGENVFMSGPAEAVFEGEFKL